MPLLNSIDLDLLGSPAHMVFLVALNVVAEDATAIAETLGRCLESGYREYNFRVIASSLTGDSWSVTSILLWFAFLKIFWRFLRDFPGARAYGPTDELYSERS